MIFWLESNTLMEISVPLSDAVKTNKKCWLNALFCIRNDTCQSKPQHHSSSISNQLELKWGCVYEHLSISLTTGSQMGFCAAERVNKLFSVQTEFKMFPRKECTAWKQAISSNKKKSLSQKKGAFSCDARHVQMGRITVWLMTAWIDMEYQAELN